MEKRNQSISAECAANVRETVSIYINVPLLRDMKIHVCEKTKCCLWEKGIINKFFRYI